MTRRKPLSKEIVMQIKNEIQSGKTKFQVSREHNLPKTTVYRLTEDLPSQSCGWPGIRGETLQVLQGLVTKGYFVDRCYNTKQRYIQLKKYFPTVHKVKMYGKNIFFIEGMEDVAVRALLEIIEKKIVSYQELKQITKVFDTDLSRREKEGFLFKNRSKKWAKNQGVQKEVSLREKDDSFSFFYIREY
jgi:hypothetical protein